MPRNGSGTYALPSGQPVVTNTTISSTTFNALTADLANALTTSVATDGQTAMTANLPMGGHKLTGLAAATGAGEGLRYENLSDIQAQTYIAFTTAGTSTAYTLTPTPAITAYTAGQSFFVTFNAACGAAPTIAINGVATPPNLVKENPDGTFSNLAAGDIPINHRSRVTLLSATQAWVETLPDVSLGRGQTVQDVTASRSLSTTFTNSTGRPIFVTVRIASSSTTATHINLTVAGVVLLGTDVAATGFGTHLSAIVPAGATYSAAAAGGAGTLNQWIEVR